MITSQKKISKPIETKLAGKVKQIDWDKYYGKIHFGQDGLIYQKEIRNENG